MHCAEGRHHCLFCQGKRENGGEIHCSLSAALTKTQFPTYPAFMLGSVLLLRKDQCRPAHSLRLQIDSYLDTIGNPNEGNAAVHPVVLAVEGHRPGNLA